MRFIVGTAIAAVALIGVLLISSHDDRYVVTVQLENAGGLRNGANVRVGGAPAGKVTNVHINDDDLAVADLRLDDEIAPVGAGASAVVDTDGIFGERFVQIDRGDLSKPQPDGSTIPAGRTEVSVRVDDVVDALDLDTRNALGVFLREQGAAIVGRGEDLAAVLAALPPNLDRTGELLDQFATDNAALGALVEESDRVVAGIADKREDFGRLIASFAETLDTLDARRDDLGQTVELAPGTLRSARATLVDLQNATSPLIAAAHGLQDTAPALVETLQELPGFADASAPALATIDRIAPDLQRLGERATPVVRELRPMASTLADYTQRGFEPFTDTLDKGAADIFGVMEGWARSTQGRDASSHIFRFGASAGSDTLSLLLNPPARKKPQRSKRTPAAPAHETAPAPTATAPAQSAPAKPPLLSVLPTDTLEKVNEVLQQATGETLDTVQQALGNPQDVRPLLDYLLGR